LKINTQKRKPRVVNPSVKNLIFDLGGVILDLSVEATLNSFAKVSGMEKNESKRLFLSSPGFELYEKGEYGDEEFREFVRNLYKISASDEVLDACWNAMLLRIPKNKLELLETLKSRYNVYLLSNTNNIHLEYINNVLLPVSGNNFLDDFFHRAYYSHRMKKRKPDAEIFDQVLSENNFLPHETLFLDDNQQNVEGASKLGIQTVYVTHPDLILDYFS
jgi:HAD superfamily hydrolase (TIGR01509 family)